MSSIPSLRLKEIFKNSKPPSLLIKDQIGTGAYGTVRNAELDGRPVAAKTIHLQLLQAEGVQGEAVIDDFARECHLLEGVDHPHIVRYLHSYFDERRGEPVLVMEKMHNNLREFVKENRGKLTRSRQIELAFDIAKGLHYLHTREPPVVHRDLNDKNIMIDEAGIGKIGDLGQSRLKKSPFEYFQTKQPGAVVFMPPEAMINDPRYNESVDMFSFGVLLLEIATQHPPTPGLQGIGTDREVNRRSDDLNRLDDDHPLRPLILDCLQDDPKKRPNITQVHDCLQELRKAYKPSAAEKFRQAKGKLRHGLQLVRDVLRKGESLQVVCDQLELATAGKLAAAIREDFGRMTEMEKVIGRDQMKVVFFGRTSNGKSTVINALLKEKVLPVGIGPTTRCFLCVTGQSETEEGGFAILEHSVDTVKLESVNELDTLLRKPTLQPSKGITVYWAIKQCPMLSGDVLLVDCPGLNTSKETDAKVIEHCSDADIFVYVCNGVTTFETAEQALFEEVSQKVSKPSNSFVLFNHWDTAEHEDASMVKETKMKHYAKVKEILVERLKVMDEATAENRTFFVSAREAFENCLPQQKRHSLPPDCVMDSHFETSQSRRQREFENFESMLHECLSEAAIETKFKRHSYECVKVACKMKHYLGLLLEECTARMQRNGEESSLEEERIAQLVQGKMDLLDEMKWAALMETAVTDTEKKVNSIFEHARRQISDKVKGFDAVLNPSAVEQYTSALLEHLDDLVIEDGTRELRAHLQQQHEEALRSVRCDYKQLCEKDKTELLSTSSVSLPSVAAASLGGALKPQLSFKHYLKSLYSMVTGATLIAITAAGVAAGAMVDPEAVMTTLMPGVSPIDPALFSVATGTVTFASCASLAVAYKRVQWQRKGSNPEKITQVKEQVTAHLMGKLLEVRDAVKENCCKTIENSLRSERDEMLAGLAEVILVHEKRKADLDEMGETLQNCYRRAEALQQELDSVVKVFKLFNAEYLGEQCEGLAVDN